MVWLVNKEVTLADGRKITALVPQVYLVARDSDITSHGAVISANQIIGNVHTVDNSGVIAGRDVARLNSYEVQNRGTIAADVVNITTERFRQLGGKTQAVENLTVFANQSLEIESTLSDATSREGNFSRTMLDKTASLSVTGKNGEMNLLSNGDITVKAADIQSEGKVTIDGKRVNITTLQTHNKEHYNGDADNYYRLDQQAEVGSAITGKTGVSVISDTDNTLRQASLGSENGLVEVGSREGNVTIEVGRAEEQLATSSKSTSRGLFSKTTTINRHYHDNREAVGSDLDGQNVSVWASKGDVTVKGSNAVAEQDLVMMGNNVSIISDVNTHFQQDETTKRKSGLMGSGGIGFTIGSKKENVNEDNTQESAARSQVGSLSGNTWIKAKDHYQQTGSVVSSAKGDVDIDAKSVDIGAARSDYESNYRYEMKQKGFTIALTGAAVSAIQAVKSTANSVKTVGDSKNNRINALAAANAGFDGLRAVEAGLALKEAIAQNGLAQGVSSGVGVSVTYGQQKSVQTQHSEGNIAEKSQVNAGGKVNIRATGAGKDSTLTIAGSDVSGQAGTHLKAEGDVNLHAIDENHLERSKNKSSGFNVGVAIQFGNGVSAGITAGGNVAKGYGNGDSQAWVASQVGSAASKTTIESGKDTSIKGSQARGNRVEVKAENLHIESLQDTARYEGKQENASAQVTVGYGFSASGSYSRSKINSNYASVKTQAGIFAGDEGYDVDVEKHTELTGGLVTSSDKSEAEGRNRFSTGTLSARDIENTSSVSGRGFGLNGGISVSGGKAPQEIAGVKLKPVGENHKDGSSKVEFGGVAGVASQGNWGITKGLATGVLGQVSRHSEESGITTSSINTKNITIKDEIAQQQLGTSSSEIIEKVNKENVHHEVNKTDVETFKSELEKKCGNIAGFCG